jgi:flavin reductase (DIM6/NTAB) family NADH-FMN oxidoreductase RutF
VSTGVDPAQFRQLLGRFATGVSVLTACGPDGPVGMTASSIASISLHPPLLLVAVDHANDMHAAMVGASQFVVNILATDQEAVARRFASEKTNRFDGVGYRENRHGVPLIDGALAHIECTKHASIPGGDHTVFFGLVTGGEVTNRNPLLYYRGGYASLGG